MFGTILLSACTFMHIYVFWRAASVPLVGRNVPRKILIGAAVILWAIFVFGRIIGHDGEGFLAGAFEFLGMTWMGILFLIFIPLFVVDLTTLFGLFMPQVSPSLRGWALITGGVLSSIAIFQGLRPPILEEYEVSLPCLPAEMDGTVLVALSDMHLGSQLGEHWLSDRIDQVKALHPDIVVLLGDIFEGHGPPEEPLIRTLGKLSTPLGIWAVPGNHEFHHGGGISQFGAISFKLLRNNWVEVSPGLILAGVDDLTNRHRSGRGSYPISKTLAGRPPGTVIFLSHTPWQAEDVAKEGAGLMLCGHTHGGQIWPFDYLVRSRYPLLEGRYDVDGMPVIVCRGTGTWGPRMRLWRPNEIVAVTLRGKE